MFPSFTKCIHSFVKPFGEFTTKENLQQQRLDNKMKYVKTCLHRTKWIEFHGWRWSGKKVNGMHYIRNFFLWMFSTSFLSSGQFIRVTVTQLSSVRSAAMGLCIFGSAALLNNSLVVRTDWRPNHQQPVTRTITLSNLNESLVNCYHFQSHTIANTFVSRKIWKNEQRECALCCAVLCCIVHIHSSIHPHTYIRTYTLANTYTAKMAAEAERKKVSNHGNTKYI